MSKAFTKDDAVSDEVIVPLRAPLPADTPNYVTPRGLAALREELTELNSKRHALATSRDPALGALEALAVRASHLEDRIATARVVDPATQPQGEARFGARVTVRTEDGAVRPYQIVGVDEADAGKGLVAFTSPLARAILGKQVGETAVVRTPHGDEELDIVSIEKVCSHG